MSRIRRHCANSYLVISYLNGNKQGPETCTTRTLFSHNNHISEWSLFAFSHRPVVMALTLTGATGLNCAAAKTWRLLGFGVWSFSTNRQVNAQLVCFISRKYVDVAGFVNTTNEACTFHIALPLALPSSESGWMRRTLLNYSSDHLPYSFWSWKHNLLFLLLALPFHVNPVLTVYVSVQYYE